MMLTEALMGLRSNPTKNAAQDIRTMLNDAHSITASRSGFYNIIVGICDVVQDVLEQVDFQLSTTEVAVTAEAASGHQLLQQVVCPVFVASKPATKKQRVKK